MKFHQMILLMIKICMIVLAFLFGVSSAMGQNLILNPGCEETLINGEIPYWTEVLGSNWTQRTANPDPFEGTAYFFPGAVLEAELSQDVNVFNLAALIDNSEIEFHFEGYVTSYTQTPSDQSRIKIEFLDALKTTKLDTFDSGLYSNYSAWNRITDTTLAPMGTRFVRIRLISTRRAGSNNDGYYDGLSLISTTPVHINQNIDPVLAPSILCQNYPNPFNPKTVINYHLGKSEYVKLVILDVLGREIITLVNSVQPEGIHTVEWNAANYPSGLYIYKIQTASFLDSKKMFLIK